MKLAADFAKHIKNLDSWSKKVIKIGSFVSVNLAISAFIIWVLYITRTNTQLLNSGLEMINTAPLIMVISLLMAMLGDIVIKHDMPDK